MYNSLHVFAFLYPCAKGLWTGNSIELKEFSFSQSKVFWGGGINIILQKCMITSSFSFMTLRFTRDWGHMKRSYGMCLNGRLKSDCTSMICHFHVNHLQILGCLKVLLSGCTNRQADIRICLHSWLKVPFDVIPVKYIWFCNVLY